MVRVLIVRELLLKTRKSSLVVDPRVERLAITIGRVMRFN